MVEIGVFSFGDTYPHPVTGQRQTAYDNLHELLERIELADRLGLHFFGVGEHHRPDFSVSACSTVLAAAAARTKSIHLGTATIVLPTDDPIRLFQQFSTLDLISSGRAELGLGGGVFLESFDLFGPDFADRNWVFEEKIELIAAANAAETVSFSGKSRRQVEDHVVWPRPYGGRLDIWQTTGLSEASFGRAARLGLSVQTGAPASEFGRLADLVALYRRDYAAAGHAAAPRVALSAHAYVGESTQQALDTFFPHYQKYVANMRLNRGKPEQTREQFEAIAADPNSNIIVGDAAQVIAKIRHQHRQIGHDRHLFQLDWRAVPHADQVRAIEILAWDVLPEIVDLTVTTEAAA